jgi:hypothetical protein
VLAYPGLNTEWEVTRRQIGALVVIVLVAGAVSATVAYRYGRGRAGVSAGSRPAQSEPASQECLPFADAGSLVGKTGCVTGLVLRVYTSRGRNTFLDFCSNYRTCPFTSVIFASDRSVFGDLGALAGKQVEIHGVVEAYEGRAEIIIRDPQQIRTLP